MTAAAFWICIVAATYSYLFYPMLLLALPSRKRQSVRKVPPIRKLAIVIAARNEAASIAAKLNNTLALERRDIDVEVIVTSDASDDATDAIVGDYKCRGVRLVRSPVRGGKERAQELAIASTDADVIIFTDVGTTLPTDALERVLYAFKDSGVGAVSSIDRIISADGTLQGEGLYVRYEMWLRHLEANFYSLVGLSGSFFAARRVVCGKWDSRVQSDFGTALSCVQLGMRAISDRNVIGLYKNVVDARKEYQRKVRTVTRGINSLLLRPEVLNVKLYGGFAFEVISHKVMRWAAPWFLLAALCVNVIGLKHGSLYEVLLALQISLYSLPIAWRLFPMLRKFSAIRIAAYFVEVNAAILHACVLAISGRSILSWEPSKR